MILVDANPLIALIDPRDQLYAAAWKDLDQLKDQRMLIPSPIWVEVLFALRRTDQRQALRRFIESSKIEPLSLPSDAQFLDEVFDWLEQYGEHQPDWADGCLAVLCGRNKRLAVWTYDREFQSLWRRPDGSAIPLAASDPV